VWITRVGWPISSTRREREREGRREKQKTRECRQNVIGENKRNIKKRKRGRPENETPTDNTAEESGREKVEQIRESVRD
jgi:hypothetical protein